jgi:hypothetical protein
MERYLRAVVWVMLPAVVLLTVSACATSRPRQRPVEGGAVAGGPGSLEAVRRQLEGSWNLVSSEQISPSGQRTRLKATAVLTYDAYGNATMKGEIEDPAATADQKAALNFSGRIVIDTQQQVFRLLDVKQSESEFAALPPATIASRMRAYVFEGDMLTMTVKDPSGRVVSVNTWRKQTR